jgi:hypothetical protein
MSSGASGPLWVRELAGAGANPMQSVAMDSLKWGLNHLTNHGDTDLFPKPFEIDVLAATIPTLATAQLPAYSWHAARCMLIPKATLAFRQATQLDPMDSLLFSALMFELAPLIEKARLPITANSVFSYRFNPTPDGHYYGSTSLWTQFWESSRTAAASAPAVLVTDISDFYSQIYHHSVENYLLQAGASQEYTDTVKRMLSHLTSGVSRGIPIGPYAAHLLAELVLSPIDRLLATVTCGFFRYADDIHIICRSRSEAVEILYELANALDACKLALNYNKTKLHDREAFIAIADKMLDGHPVSDDERALISLIRNRSSSPYELISMADLSPEDLEALSTDRVVGILATYLEKDPPDFVRLRWVLRRLAQTGSSGAMEFLLSRLEDLTPALKEVSSCLLSGMPNYDGDPRPIGEQILSALVSSQ